MSNAWKCDKCGHYFETGKPYEVRSYEGNTRSGACAHKSYDLCGDCKKEFDRWIESTPYLGIDWTFLAAMAEAPVYSSKDVTPYGWPVFEDGTPIKEWDEVLDEHGHGFVAHCFSHYGTWWCVSSSHGYATRSSTGIFKRPTKEQMTAYYKKWPVEREKAYFAEIPRFKADAKASHENPFVGLVRGKHWERHEASDYYCGKCGWKVTDHDSYCPECGGALHGGGVQKTQENTNDDVNHPKHYDNGTVECIDWIEDRLSPEEFKGYLQGCALKYQFRYEDKGKPVEDLRKAQWYLKKLEELA